jgi:acetolactate synthase small subunit
MSRTAPDLCSLFRDAHDEGDLSAASLHTLTLDGDYAAQIQAGLGTLTPDDVPAAEVVLVTLLVDDSASIRSAHNEASIRAGHNTVLDALKGSRQGDGIVIHAATLSGAPLYPYVRLADAAPMDARNYQADHPRTPLYDRAVAVLGSVIAQAKTFRDAGTAVRSITLVLTDGADNASRQTAAGVRSLVDDLARQECHLVVGMGIDDGQTDFAAVFREMGIVEVLTPGNTAAEIRAACKTFSQSAVRVSQSAAAFAQAAGGGFFN